MGVQVGCLVVDCELCFCVVVVSGEVEDGVVVEMFVLGVAGGLGDPVSCADVGLGECEEESGCESSSGELFACSDLIQGLGLDGCGDAQVGVGDLDAVSFDAVNDVSAA